MPSPDASQLPSHQWSILHQILAYVLVYPDAKDTLEGIRKWWRLEGQAEPGGDEIQNVLNFLMSRGWITEREVTPAPRIYGVNKERLAEITAFLQELDCRTADEKEE